MSELSEMLLAFGRENLEALFVGAAAVAGTYALASANIHPLIILAACVVAALGVALTLQRRVRFEKLLQVGPSSAPRILAHTPAAVGRAGDCTRVCT